MWTKSPCGCETIGNLDPVYTPCARHRAEQAAYQRQAAWTQIPNGTRIQWRGEEFMVSSMSPNKRGYWLQSRPGHSLTWAEKLELERAHPELTHVYDRSQALTGNLTTAGVGPLHTPENAMQVRAEGIILASLRSSPSPLSLSDILERASRQKDAPHRGAFQGAMWWLLEQGKIRDVEGWKLTLS